MSVTVVAPDKGREGDLVAGFVPEAEDEEEEESGPKAVSTYALRRPSDPPGNEIGISLTGTSSRDCDLRFFDLDRERDLLRNPTSYEASARRVRWCSLMDLH